MLGTSLGALDGFTFVTYDGLGIVLSEGSADDVASYAVLILGPIILCIFSFSAKRICSVLNGGSRFIQVGYDILNSLS